MLVVPIGVEVGWVEVVVLLLHSQPILEIPKPQLLPELLPEPLKEMFLQPAHCVFWKLVPLFEQCPFCVQLCPLP